MLRFFFTKLLILRLIDKDVVSLGYTREGYSWSVLSLGYTGEGYSWSVPKKAPR